MIQNPDAQRDFIEVMSPYRYLVLNDKRLLVCEQSGMWEDGAIGYCLISEDSSKDEPVEIGRFLPADFEMLLRSEFKAVSTNGPLWRVQYRVEGANGRVQLSTMTVDGMQEKTISTPYISPTYEFHKFQRAGVSVQNLTSNANVTVKLVVNGRITGEAWSSGKNVAIKWVVGSSCQW